MDIIKVPSPDHPITLTLARGRVRALFQGHEIADSKNAVLLAEADYRPVWYFPREDVAMGFFGRTDRATHCPYKGHASYFTVRRDGVIAENAAWSYEDPYPAMATIQGHIAFYPDIVDIHQTTDGRASFSTDNRRSTYRRRYGCLAARALDRHDRRSGLTTTAAPQDWPFGRRSAPIL